KPEVSDRWIQQLRRNNKAISSWACTLCPDGRVFTSSPSLWEHAQSDHFKHLPSRNEELQKFRIEFEAESAQRTSTCVKFLHTHDSAGSLSDLGALNLDSLGESGDLNMRDADEVADGQPRKRPSIGDGISAGSASPFRDASASPKTPAPQTLVSLPSDNDDIILQPETRSISQEQLVTEVKSIYANLVIVEANCIEVGKKEA
ncbi:hypothetical protein BDZ45DRAFT_576886, partial [Acephala macrosclerotiorum]